MPIFGAFSYAFSIDEAKHLTSRDHYEIGEINSRPGIFREAQRRISSRHHRGHLMPKVFAVIFRVKRVDLSAKMRFAGNVIIERKSESLTATSSSDRSIERCCSLPISSRDLIVIATRDRKRFILDEAFRKIGLTNFYNRRSCEIVASLVRPICSECSFRIVRRSARVSKFQNSPTLGDREISRDRHVIGSRTCRDKGEFRKEKRKKRKGEREREGEYLATRGRREKCARKLTRT